MKIFNKKAENQKKLFHVLYQTRTDKSCAIRRDKEIFTN